MGLPMFNTCPKCGRQTTYEEQLAGQLCSQCGSVKAQITANWEAHGFR